MKNRTQWTTIVIAGFMGLAGVANAQSRSGQRNRQIGPTDQSTQIKQVVTAQIKQSLVATDQEWAVLGPKIARVQQLQSDMISGGAILIAYQVLGADFIFMAGRDPTAAFATSTSAATPVQQNIQSLQEALVNREVSSEDIQRRMAALREARKQARNDLVAAQAELIDVLTPRQEAMLLQMGLLD
jgi:hypothetical protein